MARAALCGVLCLLQSPLGAGGLPNTPPDANALVRKMIANYQQASSFQMTSEAKVIATGYPAYVQTSSVKFKRPNLLAISSQDPYQGTVSVYADNLTVTIYSGKQNIFTRRNAPRAIGPTLAVYEKAAEDSLRIKTAQVLSPLSFLLAKGLPREATSFRYGAMETVKGRKLHRVIGQADTAWLQKFILDSDEVKVIPDKKDIIFWIDAQNNLLAKTLCRFTWRIVVPGDKKPKSVTGAIAFEETYTSAALNTSLADTEFRFVPPKGAQQIFQETR